MRRDGSDGQLLSEWNKERPLCAAVGTHTSRLIALKGAHIIQKNNMKTIKPLNHLST